MPKSPTRPTQYPSPQWARALHRGKPRHSCRGGRPEGSGGHDRKLHQALPFHVGGGIGPESITRKSEMANHNSRVTWIHDLLRLGQTCETKNEQAFVSRKSQPVQNYRK